MANENFALKFTSSAFLRGWQHDRCWLPGHTSTTVVLPARGQIQMDQSELRLKPSCEFPLLTTRSQASQESRRGEFLRQSFRSPRVFRPPKHTYLEWNLLGFMELLFLLRFGTFPVEEEKRFVEWGLASDGWSHRPSHYFSNGLPDDFTKRRQNGSKLAKRDKLVTHLG